MHPLPESFTRTIIELHEDEGVAWLNRLPAIIDAYTHQWSLSVGAPFPDLSYNYVAPATRSDGTPAVLKLGIPKQELPLEIEALCLYNGRGIAQLLEADREGGALLLERLQPGTMLYQVAREDDEAATAIAAEVMRQLWQPAPPAHTFPTVADWAKGLQRLRHQFGSGTGPLPAQLVTKAEALFDELLPSQAAPVLLHGDLHHYNILAAERRPWLAIDPKGVIGEPAYEVGALLRNPLDLHQWPDPDRVLARRVDQLSELLGFDRQRILAWHTAQAVLSAWWTIEDHGYIEQSDIAILERLARI